MLVCAVSEGAGQYGVRAASRTCGGAIPQDQVQYGRSRGRKVDVTSLQRQRQACRTIWNRGNPFTKHTDIMFMRDHYIHFTVL